MTDGRYMLVTLPTTGATADDFDFDKIQTRSEGYCECYKSKIPPQLKFESLDSLMTLSDDLVRIDSSVGTVVRRLTTIWIDVNRDVVLKDKWNETDLTQFRWDETKYPFTESAKTLTNRIYKDIQQTEVRLREMMSKYQTSVRDLSIENKKESGTLLTRRLDKDIPDDIILDSEYMQSVFVVIQKSQHKEFKKGYESLCDYVVPESDILVTSDDDYELHRVIVFKKLLDDFKGGCRENHYNVREFKKEDVVEETSKSSLEERIQNQKSQLTRYCEANFMHVLHAWFHIKVLRLFCDSVLHYGLPTKYELVVMKMKKETKKMMKNVVGKRTQDGFEVNYIPTKEDVGYDPEGQDVTFPFVFTMVNVDYLFNPNSLISR